MSSGCHMGSNAFRVVYPQVFRFVRPVPESATSNPLFKKVSPF